MNDALQVMHPLEGRRMTQGVASSCKEMNGAVQALHPPFGRGMATLRVLHPLV
jgi:hypothetical protein